MLQKIQNESLTIMISSLGGELQSIKDSEGAEYLWQGDPKYWPNRATNIFPYVARLTEETYSLNGTKYHMAIHGFAKKSEMNPANEGQNCIDFSFLNSAESYEMYPYQFKYSIRYTLNNNTLYISYEVENRDSKTMYFGLGGHPGFNVPLEPDLDFSDYYLAFEHKHQPTMVGFTEYCFVSGQDAHFPLVDGQYLMLNHQLFDNDAIILKNMDKRITLLSKKGKKSVTVSYPQMGYLGLWHKPKTDANYICIEPWTSLPSRQGIIEDLSLQSDLISLAAGETYRNTWSITIN
ncbi:MAG: aldose 1-epimerase family protein [Eubacteriales bacterium]|nr:aldose 1-epimerase family protein [Eubacteriales bacterium]